jgi:hypothetical protein
MSITRTHTIYFVCKGTSTNDIINSVNKTFKEKKKSLSNYFWGKKQNNNLNKQTKIDLDEFSPLEEIGIKEMYMCKDSENIIKNINLVNDVMHIYTALDLSAIESGLILSQGKNFPITITPLPYMSNDKSINSKNLRLFIELFGSLIGNTTNSRSYWTSKKSQFLNIDVIRPLIDWGEILRNDKHLTSYNIDKFKSIFKDNFLENYITTAHIPPQLLPATGIQRQFEIPIIVADYELIHKLLRNISSKDSKLYEIERGSIWKVDIEISFIHSGGRITRKDIKYKNFVKQYPIEYNHTPLKYINRTTFEYNFNGMSYILFNGKNEIPLQFIKGMNFFRLSDDKKLAIVKAIEISNKKINNRKNNTKNYNNQYLVQPSAPPFLFDSQ